MARGKFTEQASFLFAPCLPMYTSSITEMDTFRSIRAFMVQISRSPAHLVSFVQHTRRPVTTTAGCELTRTTAKKTKFGREHKS